MAKRQHNKKTAHTGSVLGARIVSLGGGEYAYVRLPEQKTPQVKVGSEAMAEAIAGFNGEDIAKFVVVELEALHERFPDAGWTKYLPELAEAE